jgi:hypothetical protein
MIDLKEEGKMAICPYFKGNSKSGKHFYISCCDKNQKSSFSFEDEKNFKTKLKTCSGGELLNECRPFLFRQCEELGLIFPKEKSYSTDELRKIYSNNKQEVKTMSEEIIKEGEMSPHYQEAVELTRQIKMNGALAAEAFVEVCKGLKKMRDERLYIELGFLSFDEYIEGAIGIKARQAYNYISTYERLGATFLQSNANLGITKLGLLAAAPATERDALLEANDLEDMSTREVADLVKELNDKGEQLTLITSERDRLKEEIEESAASPDDAEVLAEKIAELEHQKQETEKELEELKAKGSVPDKKTIERLKKEAKEKAEEGLPAKIKAAEDKAAETARKKALEEANGLIKTTAEGKKAAIEQAAAADARAASLEKQLAIAGNSETAVFAHIFGELQLTFRSAFERIEKIRVADATTALKYIGAVDKLLDIMKDTVKTARQAIREANEGAADAEDLTGEHDDTDDDADEDDGDKTEE